MNLMRNLATSNELTESSCIGGKPTKTFLLIRKSVQNSISDSFELLPGYQLPSKCKTTFLKVQLKCGLFNSEDTTTNCCKLMQICSDIKELNIQENFDQNNGMDVDRNSLKDWFISTVSIKGLKQTSGKSVFN